MIKFSIAPMMACTDRHYRYFARLLTRKALLYTEMITADAIIHGDRERFLGYDPIEHPVALQLGGSDPEKLAICTKIADDYGYDEINLNVGCPSERVQSGSFGACLMKEPALVADCVAAMKSVTQLPVTVKTRIGVDDQDSYEFLHDFIGCLVQEKIDGVIVHARKAWLKGLSPKQNRTVPPLSYESVYQLKRDFPNLPLSINGGIDNLEQAKQHLLQVDSVMMGRAAYYDSYLLAHVDKEIFGVDGDAPSRSEIMETMQRYIEQQVKLGVKSTHITRHMIGIFKGQPEAKKWRRLLCTPT